MIDATDREVPYEKFTNMRIFDDIADIRAIGAAYMLYIILIAPSDLSGVRKKNLE